MGVKSEKIRDTDRNYVTGKPDKMPQELLEDIENQPLGTKNSAAKESAYDK